MDLKAIAVKGLKNASKLVLKDLEALPEEAFAKAYGEKTRTIADIVYEVNLVNDHVGMVLQGEKPFDWPEGWLRAPADFQSKQAVIKGFTESSEKAIATAESFSPEQMEEPITTDDGTSTRYQECQFMVLHMWYHLGQLNYVQTIIGDDDWHWN